MRNQVAGLPRFRSAPAFEEALCTSCLRAGDPDPYWPIDNTAWQTINGKLDLHTCLACRAERRHRREARSRKDDRAPASVVACRANGAA
jgi:hypothetical protein